MIYYSSYSQLGLKVIHARPTEYFGFEVKPTISGEIFYKKVQSKNIIVPRFGAGFIRFTPRLDTFPDVGFVITSTTYTVVPGKLAPSKVNLIYTNFGLDFRIKISDSLNFYPGFDVQAGLILTKHWESYPGYCTGYSCNTYSYEANYTDNYLFFGGGIRIGVEYIFRKKIAFFVEAKRNVNKDTRGVFINYNEYVVGLRYKFKNKK